MLKLPDSGDIHGGLAALTELAEAFREAKEITGTESERRKVNTQLDPMVSSELTKLRYLHIYRIFP